MLFVIISIIILALLKYVSECVVSFTKSRHTHVHPYHVCCAPVYLTFDARVCHNMTVTVYVLPIHINKRFINVFVWNFYLELFIVFSFSLYYSGLGKRATCNVTAKESERDTKQARSFPLKCDEKKGDWHIRSSKLERKGGRWLAIVFNCDCYTTTRKSIVEF